jgi:hypothetical protein
MVLTYHIKPFWLKSILIVTFYARPTIVTRENKINLK